ncbi:hypothetical protein [Symmachiella dynata]|uniref:hypothetical protein n=1 Tax=Symmachiella dynata TaxID=2527995 RepID=UPI00119FF311|nr:hypothetical protein [Symmachiella dynata]
MRKSIYKTLGQIIDLLDESDWEGAAHWSSWYKNKSAALSRAKRGSDAFVAILKELQVTVSAKGLLGDIYLTPKCDRMTDIEFHQLQWKLREELYETIQELLPGR